MSGAAALPLFGDAYLADTQHLTLEEHGAYLKLLLLAWRSPNCALPDDSKRIATMLGVTPKKWAALAPSVMAFWTLSEAGWQQKRLSKERAWVAEKSAKASAAASAGKKDRAPISLPAGTKSFKDKSDRREADANDKLLENNGKPIADASANAVANGSASVGAPPPPIESKSTTPHSDLNLRAKPVPTGAANDGPDPRGPAAAAEVMRLAGMITPPRDLHLAADWLRAGANPETHIYPTVERLTASMRKKGDPPRSLRFFESAVMDAVAADEREVEEFRARLEEEGRRTQRSIDAPAQEAREREEAAERTRQRLAAAARGEPVGAE